MINQKEQTKTILTDKKYYISGNKREQYKITVKNGKIVKWEFDSFRVGGNYKVKDELSELLKIYEAALAHSKREAEFFLKFLENTTKYTKNFIIKEYEIKNQKNLDSQKQYYKRQIALYTSKLNKLEL